MRGIGAEIVFHPWVTWRLVVPLANIKFTGSKSILGSIMQTILEVPFWSIHVISSKRCSTDNCKYDIQARCPNFGCHHLADSS